MSDAEAMAQAGAKLFSNLCDIFINRGYGDIDSFAFQEIAETAGLFRREPYDPDKHGEIEDVEPGDIIYAYTELGAQMAGFSWLRQLVLDE